MIGRRGFFRVVAAAAAGLVLAPAVPTPIFTEPVAVGAIGEFETLWWLSGEWKFVPSPPFRIVEFLPDAVQSDPAVVNGQLVVEMPCVRPRYCRVIQGISGGV